MNGEVNYGGQSQHIGDNNFSSLTNLETAIEQVKKTWKENDELVDILEDLADYITQHPDREIIGLEKKTDLIYLVEHVCLKINLHVVLPKIRCQ